MQTDKCRIAELTQQLAAFRQEIAGEPTREKIIWWNRNLQSLILRLCRRLPKDDPIRCVALDFLTRENLAPSILRQHEDGLPVDQHRKAVPNGDS